MIINGTSYHSTTSPEVIKILEECRQSGKRIRLHYGTTKRGEKKPIGTDWLDEWSVTGTIGRSMGGGRTWREAGPIKVPILIANRRSSGGPHILDHCIVRIRETGKNGRELYRHKNYHQGEASIHSMNVGQSPWFEVRVDGEVHAKFETKKKAERWIIKMGFQQDILGEDPS